LSHGRTKKLLNEEFPQHFILFKPRDIVSGDFYWMTKVDKKVCVVAADCTGHGVPGAFGKKFMTKAFKKLLLEIQDTSMVEHGNILDDKLIEWMGDLNQVDDIIVIGLKIE